MYGFGLYTLSTTTETRAGDGKLKKDGRHERVHMAESKQECVYVCNRIVGFIKDRMRMKL